MRFSTIQVIRMPLLAALLLGLTADAHAAQRGVVTAATVSPASAQVGTAISVSVTGKNPCGAVHIDWGDGTAITYPIRDLTTTQKHAYEKPGKYAIVARGMGNCDGGTTVHVRISPAPAPPDAPQITAFTVSIPAPVGSPVGVRADGRGTCRFTVDFGDGKSEDLTVPLPHTVRHVYSAPGTYAVVATAIAPCEGRYSVKLNIAGLTAGEKQTESGPRLLGIKVAPNPVPSRTRATITIDGRGTCPVTVDFGDGRDQAIRAPLPAQISHMYARGGLYEVYAWTEAPCEGEATASVRVRQGRE